MRVRTTGDIASSTKVAGSSKRVISPTKREETFNEKYSTEVHHPNPLCIHNSINHLQFDYHFGSREGSSPDPLYRDKLHELMDQIKEQKEHVNLHLKMIHSNKSEMLSKVSSLTKRLSHNKEEAKEIEAACYANIEYVDNIIKTIVNFRPVIQLRQQEEPDQDLEVLKAQLQYQKNTIQHQQQKILMLERTARTIETTERAFSSERCDRMKSHKTSSAFRETSSKSPINKVTQERQEEFNSYWRDQYTDIYQKWDQQNRLISKLRTQIDQLLRGQQPQKKPNQEKIDRELQRSREIIKKLKEYQQLQEQQITVMKQQMERVKEEAQKQLDELVNQKESDQITIRNLQLSQELSKREFEKRLVEKDLEQMDEMRQLRDKIIQFTQVLEQNDMLQQKIEDKNTLLQQRDIDIGILRQQLQIEREEKIKNNIAFDQKTKDLEEQIQNLNERMEQETSSEHIKCEKKIADLQKVILLTSQRAELLELKEQQIISLNNLLLNQESEINQYKLEKLQLQKEYKENLQIKEDQIMSLNDIINHQEQDIERLNEEVTTKDKRLTEMSELESMNQLDRIRRASKMISVSPSSRRLSTLAGVADSKDSNSAKRSFSLSGKLAMLSIRKSILKKPMFQVEEESEHLSIAPPIQQLERTQRPTIIVTEVNENDNSGSDGKLGTKKRELESRVSKLQEYNQTLSEDLQNLRQENESFASQIQQLKQEKDLLQSVIEKQQDESDSSSEGSNIETQQQLESCQQEIETLSNALSSKDKQVKDLRDENEQLLKEVLLYKQQASQQREMRNMMVEEIRSRASTQFEPEGEREREAPGDDYELKKIENRMNQNLKKMVQMKTKMDKLKQSLEGYGEKLGVMTGGKRRSQAGVDLSEQEESITQLISDFLFAMDSMNQIQRQIEYDHDARVSKENEKQRVLVSSNIQLKQQLRQAQESQNLLMSAQKKIGELEQEIKKLKVDNLNLQELLNKKSKSEFGSSMKSSLRQQSVDEGVPKPRVSIFNLTMDNKDQILATKEKEIDLLKRELKDAQEMIALLSDKGRQKQSQDLSLSVPITSSGGRVSMMGQQIENDSRSLNDKQIGYLNRRVADLQKKLDLKQAELLQEQDRSRKVRAEFEEIFQKFEDEVRIRDFQIQDLHEQLARLEQN